MAALDYELGYLFEPASAPSSWAPSAERPLARFWRFKERVAMTSLAPWLDAQIADPRAGIANVQSGMAPEAYCAAVDRVRRYIAEGDCYQVNFTFPLDFDWFGHPLALYARLRARQPVRYGGFVGDAHSGLLSLSPELFLERCGDAFLTRPMKGTASRSLPSDVLRDSLKDQAENLMIVDLLRNDLGRIACSGSVTVDALFEIEAYPTVWQMVSQISARAPGVGLAASLQAMFPCGSITGAPKIRAMQIIAELETGARGAYTGAFGWIGPNGDYRLNVAIRTLELQPDGRGKMGIGSGVVADSAPVAEWEECCLKGAFLTACDPGLKLIETLRCEAGQFPALDWHLARLRHSAKALGFAYDEAVLKARLAGVEQPGVRRVRVTLAHSGQIELSDGELNVLPEGVLLARLAEQRIDSRDVLRRHKTTVREIYDQALAQLPPDGSVFDIVFCNERGELAEGARSTIFVDRDGLLLTPPLSSGALPGVLRAQLLASGQAREAVLLPADLENGFWLGNALRGLRRVELASAGVATG